MKHDPEPAGGLSEIVDLVEQELEGVGELVGVALTEDDIGHALPFAGGVSSARLRQDTDGPPGARS